MRICFIDFAPWDYNVATPTERPLGGSQSALCYLAVELAKAGHWVTVFTGTQKPGMVRGVECQRIDRGTPEFFRDCAFDVAVVLNGASYGQRLKAVIPSRTKLVLWTQLASNQVAMRRLFDTRDAWDSIVCVSDWHAQDILSAFGCDPERVTVIRNAIAPAFEGMFASEADLAAAKSGSPRLAYTSTPYRGLQFLASIFPAYREAHPDATLEVYSSMAVYMESGDKDRRQFGGIYDRLSVIDGVRLAGSLPQPQLAKRLTQANIWAYPNAFPETSCIAAMEAMAAGLQIVTSDLGALPETCVGFGTFVPIDIDIDEEKASILVKNSDEFTAQFTQALERRRDPAEIYAQVLHMNQHHTWSVRAKQWSAFLEEEATC